MRYLQGAAILALLVAAMFLPTGEAHASTIYKDSVQGVEIYATSTEGVFSGTASGDLPGPWYADATYLGLVEGTFTGGTVTRTNPGSNCTNQVYDVEATLGNVGVGGGSGNGSFSGTLTHLRREIFGHCVTYSATITGALALTF